MQSCLYRSQKKGQGPEILPLLWPCQSLVQFSLCPHRASVTSASSALWLALHCCTQACAWGLCAGWALRGCQASKAIMEPGHTNKWANKCLLLGEGKREREREGGETGTLTLLGSDYITLVSGKPTYSFKPTNSPILHRSEKDGPSP